MPKTSDTKTATSASVAPITTTSAAPTKKRVTKTTAPVESVATTTPVVVAPVAAASTVADVTNTVVELSGDATESSLSEQFNVFMAKLQTVGAQFASLKNEFRALERRCTRDFKVAQKTSSKGKRRSGNREPSGFVKPTEISEELASFLKKPSGTLMARTEVTKEINAYIRANSLQDKTNGRKIIPDAPLTKLLKIAKTDELTYFNLQKYMSHHFPKKVAVSVGAV